MQHTMRRRAHLAAIAAVVGLAVSGCGLDQLAEEGAERAAEKAIEQGASGDVDIDVDGEDGFKVESSDGSFQVGSRELPDDFPSEDVPIIDGEVITSARVSEGDNTTWSVSLRVDDDSDTTYDQAVSALEAAGFESVQSSEASGFAQASFKGNGLGVSLSVLSDDSRGGVVVSYNVGTVT